MINNKKVVVVTPAGRQRYMELLQHFVVNNSLIDEWQIWQNTNNKSDLKFFSNLAKIKKNIRLIKIKNISGHYTDIHKFFTYATEPDTVYIRLDDDIVWMGENAIENLLNFRIKNPDYFLVFGNIINNAICDHIHQRMGLLEGLSQVSYACFARLGWADGPACVVKHNRLLDKIKNKKVAEYEFSKWVLNEYERCSINAICWFGEDFRDVAKVKIPEEEAYLCHDMPRKLNRYNAICGNSMFSHFAFNPQREYMDKTNILKEYKITSKIPDLNFTEDKNQKKFFI